jgi:hypothetical protein
MSRHDFGHIGSGGACLTGMIAAADTVEMTPSRANMMNTSIFGVLAVDLRKKAVLLSTID